MSYYFHRFNGRFYISREHCGTLSIGAAFHLPAQEIAALFSVLCDWN